MAWARLLQGIRCLKGPFTMLSSMFLRYRWRYSLLRLMIRSVTSLTVWFIAVLLVSRLSAVVHTGQQSRLFVPLPVVPGEKGDRGHRAPGAGGIGFRRLVLRSPGVLDGVDP